MAANTYTAAYLFSKVAHAALYHGCKTAILCNPERMQYAENGLTRIRECEAPNAGDYDPAAGWAGSGAKEGGYVDWVSYQAPHDRAGVIVADLIMEANSTPGDMRPSSELQNEDFLNNKLPKEVDAANIATMFSQLASANKLSFVDYDVTKDGILDTLADIEQKCYDAGNEGKIALFVRSDIYGNIQKAIANKNGFANGSVVTREITVGADTGLGDYVDDDNNIAVTLEVTEYNNFYLVKMPKDRMFQKITLLDGQSAGQEAGGYVKDGNASIELFAIPLEAGFVSVRYILDNFLVPAAALAENPELILFKDNERLFGNIEIGQANVNQKRSAYEYDIRAIYGGSLFINRKAAAFAVCDPATERTATAVKSTASSTVTFHYTGPATQLKATAITEGAPADGTFSVSGDTATYTYTAPSTAGTYIVEVTDGIGVVAELKLTITNS